MKRANEFYVFLTGLNGWVFVYELGFCVEFILVAVTEMTDIAPVWSKQLLDIQATTDCRFTLEGVCDVKQTHG